MSKPKNSPPGFRPLPAEIVERDGLTRRRVPPGAVPGSVPGTRGRVPGYVDPRTGKFVPL